MDEQPVCHPNLSLHLVRSLDEIGLNERTVQRSRHLKLKCEKEYGVFCEYVDKANVTPYLFGSQSEGATTIGLFSDTDTVCCYEEVNVIQDWQEWKQGKMNLLMLHDDTVPGYCRLQALRPDAPLPREDLPDKNSTYDCCNRTILKNTFLGTEEHGAERNGPASTIIGDRHCRDSDKVNVFRCRTWPPYADKWVSRPRRGDWPSQLLIEQAVKDGIFLVAVGYKLSKTQDIEWRISFSFTERRLMFSMNMIQLKCYVVLKMLMKSFVSPRAADSISSYHCKTAMFYCMEETDSDYWREDNLVECIVRCLRLLLTWVNNEFCPHFIIPEANLFAGKITPENKPNVNCILKDLIESNGRFLLYIPIDNLGHNIHMKLSSRQSHIRIQDSPQTIKVICDAEVNFNVGIGKCRVDYLIKNVSLEVKTLIQQVCQSIHGLVADSTQSDKYEKEAKQSFAKFSMVWLGSLLASVSLSCKRGIPREAIHWLSLGATSDTSSLLKLASIFYCSGKIHKTESVLTYVADRYLPNTMLNICTCHVRLVKSFSVDVAYQLITTEDEDARAALFFKCVLFSPQEQYCTPPALRHEFCRSVGNDMLLRDHSNNDWKVLAAVDSLPFLYYLQYITYGELGKHVMQKEALNNLEKYLTEENDCGHLETGWNLLGQCMEQEEKPEDAMRCYKTSLEIRPLNNAANRHVQILRHQSIRKGRSIIIPLTLKL